MKASDLIGSKVYDSSGEAIGHCFDVEATRTGPPLPDSMENALQVSGLLIGSGAVVLRLGYSHRDIRGPLGLRRLARRLKSYRIKWEQVAAVDHRTLKLACPKDELERLDSRGSRFPPPAKG